MNITIINDCQDANESGRQIARISSLFQSPCHLIGVKNYNELEASGNLIDILDAFEDRKGVILVNIAPRHKLNKKYSNGTPFGYFRYKNTLIVSTVDGLTLSLVKKLNLIELINILDIDKAVVRLTKDKNLQRYIINSQFRSYDFLPRVAYYLLQKDHLPSYQFNINNIADAPATVWWIDGFGNCKTTLLKTDINISKDRHISLSIGLFKFYPRLTDVPDGKLAVIIGSSGIDSRRFLEIVIQGKRAADMLNIKVADMI